MHFYSNELSASIRDFSTLDLKSDRMIKISRCSLEF